MSYQLELFHYWRSSCSWRVRWALNIKGLNCKMTAVNLLKAEQKSDDYQNKNPSMFVPTLLVDGIPYSESMAIIEWLDEVYPLPPLLPSDAQDRMFVRQLYQTISSGTQPIQNLAVMNYYSQDAEKKQQYAKHWISRGLQAYENLLQRKPKSNYSFGNQLTMADLCLIPQCYNARRFDVDLEQFPRIKEIDERCRKLPTCLDSSPEKYEN